MRTATVAHRGIGPYIAAVAAASPWTECQPQTPAEAAEEQILLGLRTVEGVPLARFAALDLVPDAAPLADLLADGFLALPGDRIVASARGRPVLDAVLRALLT